MMEHSLLLFSSATPRTETYHAAISSRMRLVTLTHRYGGRPLPTVDFIDMRAELAAGNRGKSASGWYRNSLPICSAGNRAFCC